MTNCVFCSIINGEAPAKIVREWDDAIAIIPLNPVTDGHVLVMPRTHVSDALENPEITAKSMKRASELAKAPCNLITSVGTVATQTIFHLHIHIIPRIEGDGLSLPWSGHVRH